MPNYLYGMLLVREERRRRKNHILELKHLRDVSNPYELPSAKFKKLFRLSKSCVQFIIQKLEKKSRQTDIPFKLRFLCALHFYGHGSYQVSVGSCQVISFSQPSVSRAVREVTKLIVDYLMDEFVKFPQNALAQAEVQNGFNQKYNMQGIIGAIDGCHISIVAPPEDDEFYRGNLFRNRKGYHSINTLVCCDANMKILYANARFPGSVHDSAIWMTSKLRSHCVNNFNSTENQAIFLLGDSGFSLEPWLLTPYQTTERATNHFRFNEKFIRARNIIEKCFGVLKSRFRCLLRHRTLHYHPDMACKIIYAACTLHSLQININSDDEVDDSDSDAEADDGEDENIESNVDPLNIAESENNSWFLLGSRVREIYVTKYFINNSNN